GPAAVKAIESASGAAVVIVPTLLYDSGAWRARADLQDAQGAAIGRPETAPIAAALTKEGGATAVRPPASAHQSRLQSRRWSLAGAAARPVRFGSLEAAKAFEEGVNAFDEGEFADARDAFARAAREDSRHPLPAAWQSRVAQVTGDRTAAAEAADRA